MFFWAASSALLWIVCHSVCASSLRSLGIFQYLSLLTRTLLTGVKSLLAVEAVEVVHCQWHEALC